METLPKRAQVSLELLATKIGEEILTVPIYIFEGASPPAYTKADGIYIASEVIRTEPQNVGMYVAHEIMHHVLEDPEVRSQFSQIVCNVAEDYKINQLIEVLWGYDVSKARVQGLRSKKYDKSSLRHVCMCISKKEKGCGFTLGVKHPVVHKVAYDLKKRLIKLPQVKHVGLTINSALIPLPDEESRDLFDILRANYHLVKIKQVATSLNLDELLTILWSRLYLYKPKYSVEPGETHLTLTQSVGVAPNLEQWYAHSNSRAEIAFLGARLLVEAFMGFDSWKAGLVNSLSKKLTAIGSAITREQARYNATRGWGSKKQSKRELAKLQKRKASLTKRLAKWSKVPDLIPLLTQDYQLKLKPDLKKSSLKKLRLSKETRPRFYNNELSRLVNFIAKLKFRHFKDTLDTYQRAKSLMNDALANHDGSSAQEIDPSDEEAGQQQETGSTKQQPGKGQSPAEQQEDGQESNDDTNATSAVGQPSGKSEQAGKGKSGSGVRFKQEALDLIANNLDLLSKILLEAEEFSEKLKETSTRRINEDALIDRTYVYGDNVQRLVPAEVARLYNDYTKLSFLVDLANSQLLQTAGAEPKRGPLIFAVDCSGSMMPKMYATAAGFVMAMVRLLSKQKRKCALIKFSGVIDSCIVWNDAPPSMIDLLKLLTTPSGGGTNFDTVIKAAYGIHRENGWKHTQTLLITDGYDTVDGAVVEQCTRDMRLTAVLVSNKSQVLNIPDTRHVKRSDFKEALVVTSRSLL